MERYGTSPLPALQVPGFNLSGFLQLRGFPRRSPNARRAQQFLPPNSSSAEGRPSQRPYKEQRRRENRNAAGLEDVIDFSHALPILTSGFPNSQLPQLLDSGSQHPQPGGSLCGWDRLAQSTASFWPQSCCSRLRLPSFSFGARRKGLLWHAGQNFPSPSQGRAQRGPKRLDYRV